MRERIRSWVLVCCASVALAAPAWSQGLEQFERELTDVVARLRPSVVQLTATVGKREISWSGVVLDAAGHVASAGQVLRLAEEVQVAFADGTTAKARRVGFDPVTALGVLKVDPAGLALVPVTAGDAATLKVGSMAIVVGNPFGLAGSVSVGIISGKNRAVQAGSVLLTEMLQTTAPINPGDAGGLLADRSGRMVGIITSTFGRGMSVEMLSGLVQQMLGSREMQQQLQVLAEILMRQGEFKDPQKLFAFLAQRMKELEAAGREPAEAGLPGTAPHPGHGLSAEGINFVLPQDQVLRITQALIAHGHVARGWLGLVVQPQRPADRWLMVVEEVVADGPAGAAGIAPGDEIVSLNGEVVASVVSLRTSLSRAVPGDKVELVVRRGGDERTVALVLGEAPRER